MKNSLSKRWLFLGVGVFTMLFSGVLYAWSILKIPFKESFNFSDSTLAFNFTLTMCFFCLGAFFGSLICKKAGPKITLIISGVYAAFYFVLTILTSKNPKLLPVALGVHIFDFLCLLFCMFILWRAPVNPDCYIDVIFHIIVIFFIISK